MSTTLIKNRYTFAETYTGVEDTYTPPLGTLVIYPANDAGYQQLKLGDGVTTLDKLPFVGGAGGTSLPQEVIRLGQGTNSFEINTDTQSSGNHSLASGYNSKVSNTDIREIDKTLECLEKSFGSVATAQGNATIAVGYDAHATGKLTLAYGKTTHAEGNRTQAVAPVSHTEGFQTKTGRFSAYDEGTAFKDVNVGYASHAEGNGTHALGNASHTEGLTTIAKGYGAHAEGHGSSTLCVGKITGSGTTFTITDVSDNKINVGNIYKIGETYGKVVDLTTDGSITFDVSVSSTDLQDADISLVTGVAYADHSHTEGYNCIAVGLNSHAEGTGTKAIGEASHSEGCLGIETITVDNVTYTTGAIGKYSHNQGLNTTAKGDASFAAGTRTVAAGNHSYAGGYGSLATGYAAHAQGDNTKATGKAAHTEGISTVASGEAAHAEGRLSATENTYNGNTYATGATGKYSHIEGVNNTASGEVSHAQGQRTIALGKYSHTGGYFTIATADYQTAIGKYNAEDSNALFIIGNGSNTKRKNAFTVTIDGKMYNNSHLLAELETVQCVNESCFGDINPDDYHRRATLLYPLTPLESYELTYKDGTILYTVTVTTDENGNMDYTDGFRYFRVQGTIAETSDNDFCGGIPFNLTGPTLHIPYVQQYVENTILGGSW